MKNNKIQFICFPYAGGGVIVQRFGDLVRGRRSKIGRASCRERV